jgi:hypothetical protein
VNKMPSLDALMLIGKSSKCSSRGSEGRTRNWRAIFARRLRRFSGYCFSGSSGMLTFVLGTG